MHNFGEEINIRNCLNIIMNHPRESALLLKDCK